MNKPLTKCSSKLAEPRAIATNLPKFTVGSHYIYIKTPEKEGSSAAKLQSPRLIGPQCMRFYYRLHGSTEFDVTIQVFLKKLDNKEIEMWYITGDQGKSWKEVSLEFNYHGEFMVGHFCKA